MDLTLRSFTDFILRGRIRAIGVAFAITFAPLIGTLGIVIAGFITLRKGALAGLWVTVAATLPYAIFVFSPSQPQPLGYWVMGFFVITNFFTWFFACLLKRYGNWNLLLELMALIGIILITTAHMVKPDLEEWWSKQMTHSFSQLLEIANGPLKDPSKVVLSNAPMAEQDLTEVSQEPEILGFINVAKGYATGVLTASLLLTAIFQALIARWWQFALVKKGQLREELYHIRLSPMAGFVFLATIILSYLKIGLALDLLPVLYLSFSIAGLSLVHYMAAKVKGLGWVLLVAFYTLLLVSWMVYHLPLVFQLVALAALLDVWFDWRERLDRRFS